MNYENETPKLKMTDQKGKKKPLWPEFWICCTSVKCLHQRSGYLLATTGLSVQNINYEKIA